jgi:hypothetical protein
MYVVVGQENHPERYLEDRVYGPFITYEEADAFAQNQEASELNKLTLFGGRKYLYWVKELVTP